MEGLKAARIHPLRVLMASRMLSKKQSDVPKQLMDALDTAFELAFEAVEPTGKKIMLAVDVSGSMSCGACAGSDCLTPREAASAVAMMLVRREADVQVGPCALLLTPRGELVSQPTSYLRLNIVGNIKNIYIYIYIYIFQTVAACSDYAHLSGALWSNERHASRTSCSGIDMHVGS